MDDKKYYNRKVTTNVFKPKRGKLAVLMTKKLN